MSGNQAHPDPLLPALNFLHLFFFMYFSKTIQRFVKAHLDTLLPATRNFLHLFLHVFLQVITCICPRWYIDVSKRTLIHFFEPSTYFIFLHVFLQVIKRISPRWYKDMSKRTLIHFFQPPASATSFIFFPFDILPRSFSTAGLYPPFLATAYTVYGLCGGALKSA